MPSTTMMVQEFTTLHHEAKRNKTHKFVWISDIPKANEQDKTGVTVCGRDVYVSIRLPRPTDTRCKACFK